MRRFVLDAAFNKKLLDQPAGYGLSEHNKLEHNHHW